MHGLTMQGVHRRPAAEQGSASVLAGTLVCLLVTAMMVGATVAALLVGQRRAAAGADLAALAGASAIQRGASGCSEAAAIARTNQVRLVGCREGVEIVTIEVAAEVASAFGTSWSVRARARAGPVTDSG